MTTEHDKAVELAEKHGIQVAKGEHDFGVFPQSLVAMFAEYREELAQRSGVMPATYVDENFDEEVCVAEKVREAIASLEAQKQQLQHEVARLTAAFFNEHAALEQSKARVRELEQGVEKIMATVRANLTVNKESGK